jgi:hypothetical protein
MANIPVKVSKDGEMIAFFIFPDLGIDMMVTIVNQFKKKK